MPAFAWPSVRSITARTRSRASLVAAVATTNAAASFATFVAIASSTGSAVAAAAAGLFLSSLPQSHPTEL